MAKITWKLITVRAGDLKQNPNNPKKKTDAGIKRLQKVMDKFGVVFHGIINKDKTIIDGHSRIELAKPNDKINVFVPSRQLTAEEYKEMNTLFDMAVAGTVDMQSLEQQFTEEFFEEWDITKGKDNTVSFKAKEKPPKTEWILSVKFTTEKLQLEAADALKKLGYKVEVEK